MFPSVPGVRFKERALKELAEAGNHFGKSGGTDIPAGYTYLGQFITHDITRLGRGDSSPTADLLDTFKLKQGTSPSLDLDSLYGDTERFGKDVPNDGVRFSGKESNDGLIYDLPRDRAGTAKAYIGDPRNDENYFVAQLHVLFMNLHNILVKEHADNATNEDGLNKELQFKFARRETTLIYQQIVCNDFLRRVMDKHVYEKLLDKGEMLETKKTFLKTTRGEKARIPIEFSGAAMRFGHSMVAPKYVINSSGGERGRKRRISLDEMFALTGGGGRTGQIGSDKNIIEWEFLFDLKKYGKTKSFGRTSFLDTSLVEPLLKMRNVVVETNEDPEVKKNLANRNLVRSSQIYLPCAQDVIKYLRDKNTEYSDEMGLKSCTVDLENLDRIQFPSIRKEALFYRASTFHSMQHVVSMWGFNSKIPLWVYILLEPWYNSPKKLKNQRLGKLGSIIVGETFRSLLTTSRLSILHPTPDVRYKAQFLANWTKRAGRITPKIFMFEEITMAEVVLFVYGSDAKTSKKGV